MRRFFAALALLAVVVMVLVSCRPAPTKAVIPPILDPGARVAAFDPLRSASCAACHAETYAAWRETDHALANRLPDAALAQVLRTFPKPADLAAATASQPVMILGRKPLWQVLTPAPGGRWQAHELGYDPAKNEWFNVFGDENRQPGEWGHWTGRGMNWNAMCALCHMTGYHEGYDPAADTFRSSWIEQGVGCVRCHGDPPAGHGSSAPDVSQSPYTPFRSDRTLAMQTCAPCHARNEPITAGMKPGENYHDHYRVTLPVAARTFYPDGQQRDEDFNWTSVLSSRMGHAGVTCFDCHDPHTTKTILPVANNALCMQCHSAPGRVMPGGARATVVNPLAHSRHAEGSAGNQCVSCHMPTANFMQRAPRHDHGWIKPDPLLTKELGIPNACSKCHEQEGIDWVIAKADAWYGPKLDSRQRARTRAVAALQAAAPGAVAPGLAALSVEDVPAWRATLLELLAPRASEPAVRAALEAGLSAADPLERSAAVRGLAVVPDTAPLLRPLLRDPSRLVRIDAAWALSAELPEGSPARAEFDAYLRLNLDQPTGLARLGMDLANRGRYDEALAHLERASAWDSRDSDLDLVIARLLVTRGRPAESGERYLRVALRRKDDADSPYMAALAYAEAGRSADAEKALRLALERAPDRDRVWYNLGLLLASTARLPEALEALAKAEKLAPSVADYPYAAATIHLRLGQVAAARAAAVRVLRNDPANAAARRLLAAPASP